MVGRESHICPPGRDGHGLFSNSCGEYPLFVLFAVLQMLASELGVNMAQIAYVGDDAPDAPCLEAAGLAIAVADAHASLDAIADWHTHNGGGMGAVREVCDLLLHTDART